MNVDVCVYILMAPHQINTHCVLILLLITSSIGETCNVSKMCYNARLMKIVFPLIQMGAFDTENI
jgi:hypothetical protein